MIKVLEGVTYKERVRKLNLFGLGLGISYQIYK